jgi:sulfite exporter TauE/SafE
MELDLIGVFMIGLMGGFGHCIGMCGGFVLTYTLKVNENDFIEKPNWWQRLSPHLLYSTGRIISYMIIGNLLGLLGTAIDSMVALRVQGFLEIFAGAVMILMGLDLAGIIPNLNPNTFPGVNPFKKLVTNLFTKVRRDNIIGLGFVLGFIPCGLVYAAGAKAIASSSIVGGMLIMLAFGIGTMPAMVVTGLVSGRIPRKLQSYIYRVAALLVIILGVLTIMRGLKAPDKIQKKFNLSHETHTELKIELR